MLGIFHMAYVREHPVFDKSKIRTSEDIRHVSGSDFHDPTTIADLERQIRAMPDPDDRDRSFYELSQCVAREWLLKEAGRTARALEEWLIEKTWLLGDIAVKWNQIGNRVRALELLEECLPIARSAKSEWQQGETLARLAIHFNTIGETPRAKELLSEAARLAEPGDQAGDEDAASVLFEVAANMVLLRMDDEARTLAASITNPFTRKRAEQWIGQIHAGRLA